MEKINAIKALLLQFPQWGDQPLTVDVLGNQPDSTGLFPLGLQVLSRQEDIRGNVRLHLQESFLLRRGSAVGQPAAAWLLALQHWLLTQPVAHLEPLFGPKLRLWAQQGRLLHAKQPGTGIYEVKIHAQYEKE